MDKIEKACRALCNLDTENPDTMIYEPIDIEWGRTKSRFGITSNYARVKPGVQPKPLWTTYIPWARTVEAALNLDVNLDEVRRELAKEYNSEETE
jgi:hypothetical protein